MYKLKGSKKGRIILLLFLVAGISAFFFFGLNQYLNFEFLKERHDYLERVYRESPEIFIALYMLIYIAIAALSLPGVAVATLAGGAIFGFLPALIAASFASTIGATIAFLISRFLLRDYVHERYGDKMKKIDEGFRQEGAFYLFALRLVPVFPFFIINLLMGVTAIRTITYFFVSQLGMLPGTAAYVFAGTQLSEINSPAEILSPQILLAFAILGLLPIIAKKVIGAVRGQHL